MVCFTEVQNQMYAKLYEREQQQQLVFTAVTYGSRRTSDQKASRFVCKYREIYDKSIPEFGKNGIQVGCMNSPMRSNESPGCDPHYCTENQKHSPHSNDLIKHQTTAAYDTINTTIDQSFEQKLDKEAFEHLHDDELCNVYRSGVTNSKRISSYGFIATFLNCKVTVDFDETPMAEGMRRVLRHLYRVLQYGSLPSVMCYDKACSLYLFIRKHYNQENLQSLQRTEFVKNMTMAIDSFHVKNHNRPMCKTFMRPTHPSHNGIYDNINSQIAEQMFSYFSKFQNSFQGYHYPKSTVFFLLLFHLKNCRTVGLDTSEQSVFLT
ncbi:unnamed protein product [Didymodactylos carnosus]|uniref:Uncharacterized protein n=1 Tax=Didymodactylos carnosus TaxID=1234261 RepID=A0A8S2DHE9_9BILA|nr:unnamed protein product [Didymodactylos carnosus]CAF3685876.1 unnamed protein product [Didymodactylos carnosus]